MLYVVGMVTFVTAFLDLREDRSKDKSPDVCFRHFTNLARSGISLVVFLSQAYWGRRIESPSVRYIPCELDELQTYKEVAVTAGVGMPVHRTEYHDTRSFLTLINGKVELVKRVMDADPFHSSHFAWIDFSLFHVIRDTTAAIEYLRMLGRSRLATPCMVSPGCWPKGQGADSLATAVNWRFCGGFFLGDRASLEDFHARYRKEFPALLAESGTLTWEVNVWHALELRGWECEWYKADHNDSMLRVPPHLFQVVASLTTIPSRLGTSCRKALDSLLPQVEHVYLSVPTAYKRFPGPVELPAYLTEAPYKDKVTVVRGEDLGPATKYRGALSSIPADAWVFVCDDDQEYDPALIRKMKSQIHQICVYQNRYDIIRSSTSGGLIHGYVGNLTHASLLQGLPTFPLPECASHVDDQWMSIYYFLTGVPIKPSGIEEYKDLFQTLENNHECIGADSLFALGTRVDRVRELEAAFGVRFGADGGLAVAASLPSEATM
jgi:hypothetical protein